MTQNDTTYKVLVRVLRTCTICKKSFEKGQFGQPDNNCCHTCQHWVDNLLDDQRGRLFFIINGNHYVAHSHLEDYELGPNDTLESIAKSYKSPGSNTWKGFGGDKSIIRMFTGEIYITDNLWHQGTIPKLFSHYPAFQNNAEFI